MIDLTLSLALLECFPHQRKLIRHLENSQHRSALHELAKKSNKKLIIYEEIVNCPHHNLVYPHPGQEDFNERVHSNCTIDIVELTSGKCLKAWSGPSHHGKSFQKNYIHIHAGGGGDEIHQIDIYDLMKELDISKFHILAAFVGRTNSFPHFFERIQQRLHYLHEM